MIWRPITLVISAGASFRRVSACTVLRKVAESVQLTIGQQGGCLTGNVRAPRCQDITNLQSYLLDIMQQHPVLYRIKKSHHEGNWLIRLRLDSRIDNILHLLAQICSEPANRFRGEHPGQALLQRQELKTTQGGNEPIAPCLSMYSCKSTSQSQYRVRQAPNQEKESGHTRYPQ